MATPARRRRIIQLIAIPPDSGASSTQDALALCNDDTVWWLEDYPTGTNDWVEISTATILTKKSDFV